MSFGGGGGKKAAPPPPPPPPAPTPVQVDEEILQKQRAKRRQRLQAAGRAGTILTAGGLGDPNVGRNTLLGGSV